nr:hypothetical protein BaRGS_012045 [Batillaria attramentaria]
MISGEINERPEVPDDVTVQIPEDAAEKTTVLKLGATDADVYPELYYRLSAKPERGLEYYHLTGTGTETRIRTRKPLDYEYLDLRTVTLTVDVTDGFCDGPSQKVTVEITDVNEIPVISPDYREVTVYEGFINIDPQWNLIDPDENENHRWSLISGGGGKFDVDEDSGHVFSIRELDIDPNKESQTYNMDIRVLDKDDERAKSKLRITVLDKNDNVPEFFARTYEMAANPCTKVGKILGYVRAKDDDSEFQGNDVLVFSGSSNNMTIMSDGAIVLTKPCEPEGAADFMVAHVTDLAFPDRDQRHMPKREVKPASVNADKQVEKKERAEELEEKKKREMERKKAVEKYQKELAEYQRKVNEQNNPTAAAPAAPKKKRCIIL